MAQIQAIKGFADHFQASSRLFEMMEATAREVFPRYGFGELRTPLMEYTDLSAPCTAAASNPGSRMVVAMPWQKSPRMGENTGGCFRPHSVCISGRCL